MKQYVSAAAARAVETGFVLDVGCGAGHDLEILAGAGVDSVGVDPSFVMLDAARTRLGSLPASHRLLQGKGDRLPLRDSAAAGCRMERVLIHVDSPDDVLAEVARVVRPGGFLAVFEPAWGSLSFDRDDPEGIAVARALPSGGHPDVGSRLSGMVASHGFRLLDRVSEVSFAYCLPDLPFQVEVHLERAVKGGRLSAELAAGWLARQEELDGAGAFRASWTKVLVVAARLA